MKNMCEHKKDSWMQESKFFLISDLKSRAKRINHYLLSFAFLLLTFSVCCSLYTAYAEAAVAIGKVTQIEGRVDILREGKLPAAPARIGDSVFVKDVIRTKSGSKAEITFNDATILRVAQRSRIDISEYISQDGVSKAVIYLPRGKVMANVSKTIVAQITKSPKANKFEIRTPNAVAGVRGTDFFVFHSANSTGILVTEGKVETYNPKFPDVKVEVVEGQITNVTDNKPPTRPKAATDIEIKGHEKDVTPEKPKEKAGKPASETDSAPESQQIFGYTSPDTSTPSDSTGTGGGVPVFPPPITPPVTETFPDSLPPSTPPKDTTAPIVTIAPSAYPESGDFAAGSFSISSDEAATYSYNLDALGWTSTGASLTLSGLTEGPHTLAVQATDSAGNASSINTLAFAMSRYSLAGNFYVTIGGIVSPATGEVAGVSNQNWGGWNINTGGAAPLTLYAGGTSSDTLSSNNGGYWLLIAPGTTTFKYLSYDRYGTGAGIVSGTYTETPLVHSGKIVPDGNSNGSLTTAGLYSMDTWGWLDIEGNSTGIMGGVASPWSGTPAVNYMGKYDVANGIAVGPPYLWTPEISSYNVKNATNTTFDNGMYKGFIGGVWKSDGTIEANVYSLYIDPSGNAGILKGSLTGAYYPALNMFAADGIWTPTTLTTGLNAATATFNIVSTAYNYSITSLGDFNGTGSTITVAGNEMLAATDWRYSITGQNWGVWKSIIGGDYTGTTSDIWSLSTTVILPTTIYGTQTESDGTKIDGNQWSNGVLAGKTYGYGADITTTPMTWISVGETRGTFDPVAVTWQAVQTSAWLDTNKFLAMAADPAGQAKLAQLNIPAVEVGRANLSGSGNGLIVNMNDVIFFAPNNGQAPGIWATGNVNGTYSTAPVIGTAVPLTATSGGTLNVNFIPQTFDTGAGTLLATVNGGGTLSGGSYTGPVNMNGAVAGTINTGNSTFSGTASGTAK